MANNSGATPVVRRSVNLKENRILREAVRRSTNPALPSKFSGASSGAFVGIEGSATTPIVDGDDILDGHVFILDVDELDDISALLA